MNIGNKMKTRRLELGLSVEEVANALDKNRATIYRYESGDIGNMPLSILYPVAEVLQTSPAWLMGWDEQTIASKEATANAEADAIINREAMQSSKLLKALEEALGTSAFTDEEIVKICDYCKLLISAREE